MHGGLVDKCLVSWHFGWSAEIELTKNEYDQQCFNQRINVFTNKIAFLLVEWMSIVYLSNANALTYIHSRKHL